MVRRSKSFGPAFRPAVAVDVALLAIRAGRLEALLIRRERPPFKGRGALPGGFVRRGESLDRAAARVLRERGGVGRVYREQLYTFGEPRRDPRGRVISVAYAALIDASRMRERAGVEWTPVSRLRRPAFDHARILKLAVSRLRARANYTTVAFQLMPRVFTLDELHRTYAAVMGRAADRRNFRKKILSLAILEPTGQVTSGRRNRPGRLYRLKRSGIMRLQERGVFMPYIL